jgi:hypothetical protein
MQSATACRVLASQSRASLLKRQARIPPILYLASNSRQGVPPLPELRERWYLLIYLQSAAESRESLPILYLTSNSSRRRILCESR